MFIKGKEKYDSNRSPSISSSRARDLKSDRRYRFRWEVNNVVLYHQENDSPDNIYYKCHSKDINYEGACLSLNRNILPNQKITMTFYLSDHVAVRLEGRTIWHAQLEDRNLVGIHFENMNEQTRDMVFKYILENNKGQVMQHWFEGW